MHRLKVVAVVYLVKTLVVSLAWLIVPDLPQRAMTRARQAWGWVRSGDGEGSR